MTTAESIESAFQVRGFKLATWKHQAFVERTFGEAGVSKEFEFGTVRGLFEYRVKDTPPSLSLVAVINTDRGNGDFVLCVTSFEQIAIAGRMRLRVVQFWNARLRLWFGRRAGWRLGNNAEHGLHATFTP